MTKNKSNSPWLEDQLAAAKTPAEREEILRQWGEEKLNRAAAKEEARLNAPSMIDKLRAGVAKIKKKAVTKKIPSKGKTR